MFKPILLPIVLSIICGTVLFGCGSTATKIDNPTTPTKSVSPKSAKQTVVSFAKRLGNDITVPRPAPVSFSEVVEIFKKDEVYRFESALKYLEDVHGIEALVLRSALEIYWGGMQLGVADLLADSILRTKLEIDQIDGKNQQGHSLTADDKTRREQLVEKITELNEVQDALKTLSQGHTDSGQLSAAEAIRRFPERPEGYRAMAHVHQLRGEWKRFDEQLAQAERLLGKNLDFGIMYQRAVEAYKRNVSKRQAREILETLQNTHSEYVRIQATLVFVQSDIDSTYREIEKLKAISPQHPIVLIAEPVIRKEYEISTALRQAVATPIPEQ